MSAADDLARIRRLEVAGVISYLEAAELTAGVQTGRPASMVHALGRLPLTELRARWLLLADQGNQAMGFMPSSREQLVAAILDQAS